MAIHGESYASYEDMTSRICELSSVVVPSTTKGSGPFFASVQSWLSPTLKDNGGFSVVLPDPSLNLSLPYPSDELSLLGGHQEEGNSLVHQRFGMRNNFLNSPVSSLSGGERMIVSIVKSLLLSCSTGKLLLCSPFFWLDFSHRLTVSTLLADYASKGVTISLLTLDGENCPTRCLQHSPISALEWTLSVNNASVTFPASKFPKITSPKHIFYRSENTLLLRSPTFIFGSNGVGKTTFAKLISGILSSSTFSPRISVLGYSGHARLLMQDSILQLFSCSPIQYIERVFRFDKQLSVAAISLFNEMQSGCANFLSEVSPHLSVGNRENPCTILQAKLALAAVRIISLPPLLILDEPGWCLSEVSAQAFVYEVVNASHNRNIAVALISHERSWWESMVASELLLEPIDDKSVSIKVVPNI